MYKKLGTSIVRKYRTKPSFVFVAKILNLWNIILMYLGRVVVVMRYIV